MCRQFLVAVMFALLPIIASAGQPNVADPLAAKKEEGQNSLEKAPFRFLESDANVLYSLSQYTGDCKVHIILDPKERWRLTFIFERDGKDILTVQGHPRTVFQTSKNVLFFAHFGTGTTGCKVKAYDLTTGKTLWETGFDPVGPPSHSMYSNRVTMGLSAFPDPKKEEAGGAGAVVITGRESCGEYVVVLDSKTGQILAQRIYRKGYETPKQPK